MSVILAQIIRGVLMLPLYFVLSHSFLFAQELSYKNYSTHNGLPSNQVYNMFQDRNGYMWFATDRGMSRFNGYEFENFSVNSGLPSNTVLRFYPQKDGTVWCSTRSNKWFYFNQEDYQFHNYKFNDTILKHSYDRLNDDLVFDEDGTMHIAYTLNHGIVSIDTNGNVLNELTRDAPDSINVKFFQNKTPGGDVLFYKERVGYPLSNALDGELIQYEVDANEYDYNKAANIDSTYIFTSKGYVYILSHGSKLISKFNTQKKIIGAGKYDDDHFWIGWNQGGVGIYDLKGKLKSHLLKGKSVSFCSRDQNNGIWFSTLSSGVYYSSTDKLVQFDFPVNNVRRLNKSKNGKIYAYMNFDSYYKGDVNGFSKVCDNTIGNGLVFYDKYEKKEVVVCGREAVINGESFLADIYITSYSKNENLPLLIGGHGKIAYFKNGRFFTEFSHLRANGIAWKNEDVLIGTNNGMFLLDTATYKSTKLEESLLDIRIEDISLSNKIYYVSTMGNGLVVLENDTCWNIDEKEGLSSNLVNKTIVENDSILWVATNSGLNRLKLNDDNYEVSVFNKEDGLIDNDVSDILIVNDTFWIGTRSGLCIVNREFFDRKTEQDFPFQWKYMTTNKDTFYLNSPLEFNHDQSNFSFHFHTSLFSSTDKLQFRYKLENLENEWNYSNSREINYSIIPPGNYKLIVQARLNGNWEDHELTVDLNVSPPFYQTYWFYIWVLAALSGAIYAFFKFRVLVYNEEIFRELYRQFMKRLKGEQFHFFIKEQGIDVKIDSKSVLYVKSSGNYLEMKTEDKNYVFRCKLSDFTELVPDKFEYLRVNRSYIVRIDKVRAKNLRTMILLDDTEIPIGKTYQTSLAKMEL